MRSAVRSYTHIVHRYIQVQLCTCTYSCATLHRILRPIPSSLLAFLLTVIDTYTATALLRLLRNKTTTKWTERETQNTIDHCSNDEFFVRVRKNFHFIRIASIQVSTKVTKVTKQTILVASFSFARIQMSFSHHTRNWRGLLEQGLSIAVVQGYSKDKTCHCLIHSRSEQLFVLSQLEENEIHASKCTVYNVCIQVYV